MPRRVSDVPFQHVGRCSTRVAPPGSSPPKPHFPGVRSDLRRRAGHSSALARRLLRTWQPGDENHL